VADAVQANLIKRRQSDAKRNAALPAHLDTSLAALVDYCDFRELQEIITLKANWPHFSGRFGDKEALNRRFDHVADLRNALRHSRVVGDITRQEGEAAIAWFNQTLGLV